MVHLTTVECDIALNTTSSTLFFALSRRWERRRPSSPCSSPTSTRRIAEFAYLRSGDHSRPSSKQLLLMITSSSLPLLLLVLLDLQRLVVLVPLSFAALPYNVQVCMPLELVLIAGSFRERASFFELIWCASTDQFLLFPFWCRRWFIVANAVVFVYSVLGALVSLFSICARRGPLSYSPTAWLTFLFDFVSLLVLNPWAFIFTSKSRILKACISSCIYLQLSI